MVLRSRFSPPRLRIRLSITVYFNVRRKVRPDDATPLRRGDLPQARTPLGPRKLRASRGRRAGGKHPKRRGRSGLRGSRARQVHTIDVTTRHTAASRGCAHQSPGRARRAHARRAPERVASLDPEPPRVVRREHGARPRPPRGTARETSRSGRRARRRRPPDRRRRGVPGSRTPPGGRIGLLSRWQPLSICHASRTRNHPLPRATTEPE